MALHFTGKQFVAPSGEQELAALRIGDAPKATGGRAPLEMLARVPSEECGCPEELWSLDGILLLFHFEEDGSSDAFIFAENWEAGTQFEARTLDHLRALSFGWVADQINPVETDCKTLT